MDAAVVILAGGKSRRMGNDKLILPIDGTTLLESAVNRFKEEFTDVYLSLAEEGKYPDVTVPRIVDVMPGAGPLSGLHAALTILPGGGVFLVAADLPYASARAAKRIVELRGDHDACIIRLPDGRLEPLLGYYSKTTLPLCEALINAGDYRMTELAYRSDTRFLAPSELGSLWDEKLIYNINYPGDYEKMKIL